MGAQAETHDRKMMLRHRGALPREAGSEGVRRTECQVYCHIYQGRPACARNSHSGRRRQ